MITDKKQYLTLISIIELNKNYQFTLNNEIKGIRYEITTYKESNIYFIKGFINDKPIQHATENIKECKKYLKSIII